MPRWRGLTSRAINSTASGTTPSHHDRQIKLLFPDRHLGPERMLKRWLRGADPHTGHAGCGWLTRRNPRLHGPVVSLPPAANFREAVPWRTMIVGETRSAGPTGLARINTGGPRAATRIGAAVPTGVALRAKEAARGAA